MKVSRQETTDASVQNLTKGQTVKNISMLATTILVSMEDRVHRPWDFKQDVFVHQVTRERIVKKKNIVVQPFVEMEDLVFRVAPAIAVHVWQGSADLRVKFDPNAVQTHVQMEEHVLKMIWNSRALVLPVTAEKPVKLKTNVIQILVVTMADVKLKV